jgi:isopenicillin-N N-acyltransferase-like protein
VTIKQHVSSHRDPARRGVEFGRACAAEVGAACTAYLGLFGRHVGLERVDVLRLGAEVRAALREHAPAAEVEISAIAEGAAQPVELLMAINARTEILGQAPECTVIADPATGTLGQNWDYHPDVRPGRVLWSLPADPDGWLTTFTEAGVLGKVGLNDRGVAVALNVLSTTADGAHEPGVPIHVVLRLVLERSASVDDVIAALSSLPVTSSNAVTVLGAATDHDRSPRAVTCELTPGGVRVLEANGGPLVHTNHCVHPDLAAADLTVAEYPDTVTRLAQASGLATAGMGPAGLQRALREHAPDDCGICRHDDRSADVRQSVTHASLIMSLLEPRLAISDGPPCRERYEAVPLPWA